MLRDRALIDDIHATSLSPGQLAFWWLGQHGFIVKMGSVVLCVDGFLTPMEERLAPSLLPGSAATGVDVVLGSHDHLDHIDRPAWPLVAVVSPRAKFVVPGSLLPALSQDLRMPREQFIGLDDGVSTDVTTGSGETVRITGIAAAHETLDRDPATGAYPYLGYVIECNGCAVYHSGDCCVYEGLLTKLSRWKLDVVFLPINGRDPVRLSRGCIGNMTYQEAADLAGALRPRLTVPGHYDMFAGNTEDPARFVDYMHVKYPDVPTHVCEHGKRVTLPRA